MTYYYYAAVMPVDMVLYAAAGNGGSEDVTENLQGQVQQHSVASQLQCAANLANQYSLANALGTNGKSGFFNGIANGVLGNSVSTVVSYAYGGSTTEFATTAYDVGTKAAASSINEATAATPITALGLGAEVGEIATEGFGSIFTAAKGIYDLGSFGYALYECHN